MFRRKNLNKNPEDPLVPTPSEKQEPITENTAVPDVASADESIKRYSKRRIFSRKKRGDNEVPSGAVADSGGEPISSLDVPAGTAVRFRAREKKAEPAPEGAVASHKPAPSDKS